ncbi:MAG: hypothetical protein D6780_01645, partial [Candidatus Dadabacteria bacterium]
MKIYHQILNLTPHYLWRIVQGLITFILILIIGRWLVSLILKTIEKAKIDKNVKSIIASTLRVSTVFLSILVALGTAGVDITALVAGFGIAGFAVGFALRDSLSNLIAGILILVYRPFKTGDAIQVAGQEGEVTEINLRYTCLKSTGKEVLIPNSALLTNVIVFP